MPLTKPFQRADESSKTAHPATTIPAAPGLGETAQVPVINLQHWMSEHENTRGDEFRGAMNLSRCPDPSAFERANYQRILQSWRV